MLNNAVDCNTVQLPSCRPEQRGRMLTRKTFVNEGGKEADGLRAHALNADEGVDVERGGLIDDREERHVRQADIANGNRVGAATDSEHVVIVHNRVYADTRCERKSACPGATDISRTLRADELASLCAGRAFVAGELEGL